MAQEIQYLYIPVDDGGKVIDWVALTEEQKKAYTFPNRKLATKIRKYQRQLRIVEEFCESILQDIDTTDNLDDCHSYDGKTSFWRYYQYIPDDAYHDDIQDAFDAFYSLTHGRIEINFYCETRDEMKEYFLKYIQPKVLKHISENIEYLKIKYGSPRFKKVKYCPSKTP